MNIIDWTIIGSIGFILGVVLMALCGVRGRAPEENQVRRRVVFRIREEMEEVELRRILRDWVADDRKAAIFQIVQQMIEDTQEAVAQRGLSASDREHFAGGQYWLENLLAELAEFCAGEEGD